jgi:hypothetical protein
MARGQRRTRGTSSIVGMTPGAAKSPLYHSWPFHAAYLSSSTRIYHTVSEEVTR